MGTGECCSQKVSARLLGNRKFLKEAELYAGVKTKYLTCNYCYLENKIVFLILVTHFHEECHVHFGCPPTVHLLCLF